MEESMPMPYLDIRSTTMKTEDSHLRDSAK